MATPDSRWSCKPSLGPTGSLCSITFSLADSLDIIGLNVGKNVHRNTWPDILFDVQQQAAYSSKVVHPFCFSLEQQFLRGRKFTQ